MLSELQNWVLLLELFYLLKYAEKAKIRVVRYSPLFAVIWYVHDWTETGNEWRL